MADVEPLVALARSMGFELDAMTHEEFAALVERLRAAHPVWFDLDSDAPASEEQLAAIEAELGARLPADFRWFLATYGGGDFAFGELYSADPSSHVRLPEMQAGLPARFVAFTDNGAGDRYGFPVRDGEARDEVLVHDHETGELEATSDPGFLEFVRRTALRDER
jgi:hypothetical protein